MATLKEEILQLLDCGPGLTDREITNALHGAATPQQPINIACRQMAEKGVLERQKRADGLLGNYPTGKVPEAHRPIERAHAQETDRMSEDAVKAILETWLTERGWTCKIAWGRERGIDIDASNGDRHWVIEVKGCGSRNAMRVNYFIATLGETLQRMDDPAARYSIALPDMAQFRGLWRRLPQLAKQRTRITALFVGADGTVTIHDQERDGPDATDRMDPIPKALPSIRNEKPTASADGLARRFHQEMMGIYERAARECSYRPTRFLRMVTERGGLEAARELLKSTRPAEGLTTLWEHGRLDLSMEALVCQEPWRALFTDDEIDMARQRLEHLGYTA